ncbi:hypothetical protein [Pseudoalteromonas sp. Of11M-6]|uniref:hypothetical protein n=1 Tax=Pseudoalteromonas sp. Of11M-6 TaxID=2917754 RepID=UPI001EF66C06|nr:hypothetical protein [Pseudoalteromonas sp. Of11M-6]MCG7553292.1 hypothetical protein [Pseudoalteromonas sp. Of11M-6]
MNDFIDWLIATWQALVEWFYGVCLFVINALMWLSLQVFSLILEGFRHVFSMIEPPDFIQGGISGFSSAIPNDVAYLLGVTGFADALAIIGLGYTFRLTRKLLTLFQW